MFERLGLGPRSQLQDNGPLLEEGPKEANCLKQEDEEKPREKQTFGDKIWSLCVGYMLNVVPALWYIHLVLGFVALYPIGSLLVYWSRHRNEHRSLFFLLFFVLSLLPVLFIMLCYHVWWAPSLFIPYILGIVLIEPIKTFKQLGGLSWYKHDGSLEVTMVFCQLVTLTGYFPLVPIWLVHRLRMWTSQADKDHGHCFFVFYVSLWVWLAVLRWIYYFRNLFAESLAESRFRDNYVLTEGLLALFGAKAEINVRAKSVVSSNTRVLTALTPAVFVGVLAFQFERLGYDRKCGSKLWKYTCNDEACCPIESGFLTFDFLTGLCAFTTATFMFATFGVRLVLRQARHYTGEFPEFFLPTAAGERAHEENEDRSRADFIFRPLFNLCTAASGFQH